MVHASSLFPLTPPQDLHALADSVFTVGGLARCKGACRINIGLISCKGQLCNIVYVFATPGEHSAIHIQVTTFKFVLVYTIYEHVFLNHKWRRYLVFSECTNSSVLQNKEGLIVS